MDQLLQHIANALILGGTYALLGIGLTLILGIMKVVNFTHGELYAFGAFMAYYFVSGLGWNFFVAIAMAIVLDTRLVDLKGKQKAYLTAAMSIAFAFSMYYWREATPTRLVKTALSALFFALVVGGIGGWLVGGVARLLFGPKLPKKKASASGR